MILQASLSPFYHTDLVIKLSLELCDEAQSRGSSPLEGSAGGALATQLLVVTDALIDHVKRHCISGLWTTMAARAACLFCRALS